MTLVKFKNAGSFPAISRGLNFPSFFNDAFDRLWSDENVSWMPSVNVMERNNDYKIDLAVPGMEKKDFKIEVDENVLTISGERKEELNEENEKHTRREFHYGSFRRSFTLPESANVENISASYNNGILTILVAKREGAKQVKKEISIA
jgi:HSP20 family protein